MPLQATSGAASYDAFGGGVPVVPTYIEQIFSTWLYTGNGSTQTITNGIDITGKGALVWVKGRSGTYGNWDHTLITTPISNTVALSSNTIGDTFGLGASAFSPTASGFNLNTLSASLNDSETNYVSWTLRRQPKFFDVVTYTGTGTASQTVSHNLGSAPGCIIIKRTDSTSNWFVGHNYDANRLLYLNTTAAATTLGWNSWIFDTTTFRTPSISGSPDVNVSGATYVAYVFAHNAGGFGLSGTDNVISCGSFTTDGSGNATVNLGYEPQWIIAKPSSEAGSWRIYDNMRGMNLSRTLFLNANNSDAEFDSNAGFIPNATGFTTNAQLTNPSATYIYIAIRRGPMRTPTTGTSVFAPVTATAPSSPYTVTTNFPVDLTINSSKNITAGKIFNDRLRGGTTTSYVALDSTNTSAEGIGTGAGIGFQSNTSIIDNNWQTGGTSNPIYWNFRRAPGFFDEVCYTASGSGTIVSHNLAAAPELIITKRRNASSNWGAYHSFTPTQNGYNYLDLDGAGFNATYGTSSRAFQSQPTSTQFITGGQAQIDTSGGTYVAYLFATCPGVSKVTNFTGTGTLQTINCGFTGGARFVLIKRTDSTGNWFVWDSSRGLSSSNDPYLMLNSTAAEVTSTNWVDTTSTGFQVTAEAGNNVNISGASYIALAIA